VSERNQITYDQAYALRASLCIGSCESNSLEPVHHLIGCPYRNALLGAEIVPNEDDNEK